MKPDRTLKILKLVNGYVGIHYMIFSTFVYVGIFYNKTCVFLSFQ